MNTTSKPLVINPNNIQFATPALRSKDKRMTWAPEDIKRFVSEANKERTGKNDTLPSNGQSKLNLNSITTINSNLNQITEHPAGGFRADQNIRVSAYVNATEQHRAGTSVPGKRNNINLEAV